jgi:hypothetical protein
VKLETKTKKYNERGKIIIINWRSGACLALFSRQPEKEDIVANAEV